ncbi:hypothetical protein V1503_18920 [Bacillus sp. SCS-151]|uniref:hypothetical protein n=1 Tax=Nanhaiella sioensis TaxID=3115293 RepID=UPI00397C11A5
MTNGKQTITCSACGIPRNPVQFYSSYSPFHKNTGKLHVCKQCILDYVDGKNIESLKKMLRMIDKPFLMELYESSIEEAEKSNKSIFGLYMKNLGLKHNREKTWDDSDFDGHNHSKSLPNHQSTDVDVDEEIKQLTPDETKYLKVFWGKGYKIEDLVWLQQEYEDWTNRYECDSKGMETLIQEICMTKLDIMNRRESGEKVDQQLKTLQDLLGSSNLKPVQETGANAAEQESFGTLLKKYENERPVPEPDSKWKDVDKISKYVRVFFLGHLSRMLGLNNKYKDEYWDEINKFTIEEPVNDEDDMNELI